VARRTWKTAIASVWLAAAVAACSRPASRAHVVRIQNFAFVPPELTVARGDTVVWSNDDFVPHSTTARDTSWDSRSIGANASWRFVAGSAGRHEYYCVFHPNMKAVIVVR
jgi:plastocyanin